MAAPSVYQARPHVSRARHPEARLRSGRSLVDARGRDYERRVIPIRDRLPRRRAPLVNYLLIALNVLAFLWEQAAIRNGYRSDRLLHDWGLVPRLLLSHPVDSASTVLTSMF